MKVLVQWTYSNPSDWEEIDSSEWAAQPKRSDPIGGEAIDAGKGWIFRLGCQGVELTGDHYAVEHLNPGDVVDWHDGTRVVPSGGGCRLICWSDDPEDYPDGYRNAKVWTLLALAPDSRLGGAYNTQQSLTYYADSALKTAERLEEGQILPWEDFVPPSEEITRHGIWTPNALNDRHEAVRTLRGWREWTEGVPEAEVVGGQIRAQRDVGRWSPAHGTKTFFCRTDNLANGIHVGDHENDMTRFITRVQQTEVSNNIGGSAQAIAFVFTSFANEPNDAAWPTGNYRCQLDVSAVGGDITYGLLDQTVSGHFARVNSGLTTDSETKQQAEGAFTGTGLKLATTGSVSWTAGNASDRFECVVTIARPANHGNQALTLNLGDADAFADGPWPSELEDTVAVTDQVTVQIIAAAIERTVNDTVTVTDAVTVEMEYERTISDVAVVTDQTAVALEYERTISDSVTVVDQTEAGLMFNRTVDDSVTVADAVAIELEYERTIGDAVVVTDQTVRAHDAHRIVSDFVTVVDQTTSEPQKAIDDAVVVADQATIQLEYERTILDTPAVTDQVVVALEYERTVDDTAVVTDQAAVALEYERTISDVVAVTDQVNAELVQGVIEETVNDSVVVTDAVAIAMEYGRAVSDTATVTDQALVALEYERTIDDAATVTDQTAVALEYERTASDTATVTDQTAIEMEYERTLSDSVIVTDQTIEELSGVVSVVVSDAIVVTDQAAVALEYERTIGDAVVVADATVTALEYERTLSDSVTVADQTTSEPQRSADDAVVVADALTTEANYSRTISDSVVVADQVAIEAGLNLVVDDSVTVADAVAIEVQYERTLSDSAVVADATTPQLIVPGPIVDDSVAVTDSVAVELEYGRTVADSVVAADQAVVEADGPLEFDISDSVVVADQVVTDLSRGPNISDSADVADSVVIAMSWNILPQDSVSTVDLTIINDAILLGGGPAPLTPGDADVHTVTPKV